MQHSRVRKQKQVTSHLFPVLRGKEKGRVVLLFSMILELFDVLVSVIKRKVTVSKKSKILNKNVHILVRM